MVPTKSPLPLAPGEVYRARDTKLNRDVALKVLPEAFVTDPERLARFQREAEVLASLNHPNIAQIYGLEDSGDVTALVLELVEGPTLADRIAQGPIPLDEALAIAKQVAAALEAAHEQGIIHRDLKPANIKVTPDGVVKVLDFGLAKALDPQSHGGDASESPTLATAVTGIGVIMGTAAYMSPEQARGKPVDRRADIWAFGVVVLEMLTGKRVFDAEDVSLTLAEVMKSEPDWTALPSDIPPVLRLYLRRCLRKDPKERVRDIGDVRLALEGAFEPEIESMPAADFSTPTPRRLPLLLAVLIAALTGLLIGSIMRSPSAAPEVTRTSIVLPRTHVRSNIGRRGIAVSPNGTHVAYVANNQLYLRALDALDAEPLAGTEGSAPTVPMFSPDGEWIAFYSTRDGELQKIALSGGVAVSLHETRPDPFGASWGADDTIVYGQGGRGILRVGAAGGTPEVLVATESGERASTPQLLPGGENVLFTIASDDLSGGKIVVQSLETGERRVLVEDGGSARYLASGHLVYVVAGNLLAIPFDVDRLETVGGPIALVAYVAEAPASGDWQYDLSSEGLLAYVVGLGVPQTIPVWVDRNGLETPIAVGIRNYWMVRISPDGSKAILDVRDGEDDLWVWDFERETSTRLTFTPREDTYPLWSPDGQSIVYTSQREAETNDLYRRAVDGTGVAERLMESPTDDSAYAFTPDGSGIVLAANSGGARHLALLTDGEPEAVPLFDSAVSRRDAHLSPDGRWLAYESDASGTFEVYVRPFPDVESGRWQISSGGGQSPLWGPDSRELFFWPLGGDLMRVEVDTANGFRHGNPEPLIKGGAYRNVSFRRVFDISPDGERFLMLKDGTVDDDYAGLRRIIVVQNWFEELNARVPVE